MAKPKTVKECVTYLYGVLNVADNPRSWAAGALETIETEYEKLQQQMDEITSAFEGDMWEGYTDEDLEAWYTNSVQARDWETCGYIADEINRRQGY